MKAARKGGNSAPQIKTINTHRREIKIAQRGSILSANAQECAQCYFAVEFYGFDLARKGRDQA